MIINRQFAFPSKNTFTIPPIARLIAKYVKDRSKWIDPFAGDYSPAEITNDLNFKKKTKYHLHAVEFLKLLKNQYDGCLFDPPYSLTQVKECYESIGKEDFLKTDCQSFPVNVKREIPRLIKPGGYVICCGWDSIGLGRKRGFEMVEILLVWHGQKHHDTIVTVERKVKNLFD